MVVFTCNNCGETLQKPKVAKHYEFRCRTAPFLTCSDCFKDFRGEEYVAHTKCVTEAERYGGKDYVPKPGSNKGERKQQKWINIVNSILNSNTILSNAERSFLTALSRHENIPRKKAKFLNFVSSAMGNRTNKIIVDSVWNIMETTFKNDTENTAEKQQNGKVEQKIDGEKHVNEHQENNVIENQNNENMCKESQGEDQQNESIKSHNAENDTVNNVSKKKKSKKRSKSKAVGEQTKEPVSKERSKSVVEEPVPKKSKTTVLAESSVNECGDTTEKLGFNWKGTILDIVQNKGEISLKKLQKKVISQYMSSCSDSVTNEKATSKFNKKLKKMSEVVISDDKVKLT